MKTVTARAAEDVIKFADMFSAMGTEARLRIMQLLLSAHPEGLVVSEIQEELEIPNSTLSHHLDKLRREAWSRCSARAPFFATPRTRRRYASCCNSSMPNAVPGTKR